MTITSSVSYRPAGKPPAAALIDTVTAVVAFGLSEPEPSLTVSHGASAVTL